MDYELKTERFSGPLGKLLELIDEKKLEISEISLAEVTDDFLSYLKRIERVEMPVLADFISIASRLVFLKSKSLLPGLSLDEDEEEGIKDLEKRLRMYREFRPTMKVIQDLWGRKNTEYSRPYFSVTKSLYLIQGSFFYPGDRVSVSEIVAALYRILGAFKSLKLETETIRDRVITLEEKIEEVIQKLKSGVESTFGKISNKKLKAEIVIIFLAILHLARDQRIYLEQERNFSDILIRRT